MKKVIGLGLAVALFASCSDDDSSSGSINPDNLLKKWYYVSVNANGETELWDDHEACGKDYIEFSSGGVLTNVDVYGCDGNTPLTDVFNAAYTVNGNKITATAGGETQTVTIKKLTASELKVAYTTDYDGDGDEETVTETYSSNP
ncbi:lipocalin family protein [Flavobacterium sp. MFBS3-15]|uniref:lipocalin family protein n=1 Tax=Flavobacterium sp. MFBS3-15 TaxID=2989816 RepID=UPI0022360EDE|nr:lipocalin family protein [Flavobacterium sp. MFBS3-15]MCW4468174.1 lipocalin family protein [Flavobacterium sp. MFBS3-15]